jgi:hypothetical protein
VGTNRVLFTDLDHPTLEKLVGLLPEKGALLPKTRELRQRFLEGLLVPLNLLVQTLLRLGSTLHYESQPQKKDNEKRRTYGQKRSRHHHRNTPP